MELGFCVVGDTFSAISLQVDLSAVAEQYARKGLERRMKKAVCWAIIHDPMNMNSLV